MYAVADRFKTTYYPSLPIGCSVNSNRNGLHSGFRLCAFCHSLLLITLTVVLLNLYLLRCSVTFLLRLGGRISLNLLIGGVLTIMAVLIIAASLLCYLTGLVTLSANIS
jgi:hypothetical protein